MRKAIYVSLAIALLAGCVPSFITNRANRKMDEVMSKLIVKIDKIEPKLRTQLPVSQSGLDLKIDLAIENPTKEKINAQSLVAKLEITQLGEVQLLGDVTFNKPAKVPKNGKVVVPILLQFKYDDIRRSWKQVANIALGHQTTWRLVGDLEVKAFGLTHRKKVDISDTTGFRSEGGQAGKQAPINEGLSSAISDGLSMLSAVGASVMGNVDDALTRVIENNRMVVAQPNFPPEWPDQAKFSKANPAGRYTQTVRTKVTVGREGLPINIEVLSGPKEFHKNATDYVRQFKFRAQTGQDGQPRTYEHYVSVPFELVVK